MTSFSVIIPAYNAAQTIAATLQSAREQSATALEILVVDDCSTDQTAAIAAQIAAEDPRVHLLHLARNSGPSAARNLGLAAATAEWVALLDADDAMAPDRLARLAALAEAHQADMASDNLLLVYEDQSQAAAPMIPTTVLGREQRLSLTEFIHRNVGDPKHPRVSYGFMKPIIRRAFLNQHAIRYDEQVRFAEDFALYVRCLAAGAVWWLTPEPLYHYTIRTHSLTEVQTSSDLDRLRRRQRALLTQAAVRNDAALRAAILRHLAVIDRNFYYRSFTDAVKAKRLMQAAAILIDSPQSPGLILAESLRQTPTIAAKLMRGGYRRPRTR